LPAGGARHADREPIWRAGAAPGGPAISVEQTLRFRPEDFSDTITARAEVIGIVAPQRRLRCRTTCRNQRDELVISGEAIEQKDE
jgi:3-hydroxybutyryl-CoA dehydratase